MDYKPKMQEWIEEASAKYKFENPVEQYASELLQTAFALYKTASYKFLNSTRNNRTGAPNLAGRS
jgi:hypothetical protein